MIRPPEPEIIDNEPEYELEREVEDIDIAASDAAIDAAFNAAIDDAAIDDAAIDDAAIDDAAIDDADSEDTKQVAVLKHALINSQMSLALTTSRINVVGRHIPDQGRMFFFLHKVSLHHFFFIDISTTLNDLDLIPSSFSVIEANNSRSRRVKSLTTLYLSRVGMFQVQSSNG